jgi:hypothetical protein
MFRWLFSATYAASRPALLVEIGQRFGVGINDTLLRGVLPP